MNASTIMRIILRLVELCLRHHRSFTISLPFHPHLFLIPSSQGEKRRRLGCVKRGSGGGRWLSRHTPSATHVPCPLHDSLQKTGKAMRSEAILTVVTDSCLLVV